MSDAASRLDEIRRRIAAAEIEAERQPGSVRLIAVSKFFAADAVRPLIEAGQRDFGENRVQEAMAKWPTLKEEQPDIRLHLIGPLQSNKASDAVGLFDAIHSVDRDKIAGAIAGELDRQGRSVELLVQVNTGGEPQKAGVPPRDAAAFVERCRSEHGLLIAGLMAIPPIDEAPGPHFALLAKIAVEAGVERLSMGMSADFETAIAFGATDIRVGEALFGRRTAAPAGR
jgi:pyridoxal phosphate enzyme (YggS family)